MNSRLIPGGMFVVAISILGIADAESLSEVQGPVTATFSIVALDPESGTCGAAVASKYPAVGKVVPYVRAGVGGFCTQHHHVPTWGEHDHLE